MNSSAKITASLLQQNWGVPVADVEDWERLRAMLCIRLQAMLAEDFAGLVNAMYRLDVPESRFRAALAQPSTASVADALADAVLDRERLRAEMRIRYAKPNHDT